jgi:hypothetical protein
MRGVVLLIVAGLAGASVTRASITNVTYSNYTGGMMTNAWAAWNSSQVSLSIHGGQVGSPGLGGGTIYTSSAEDPTLTIRNIIDNDTAFTWTAYHVNVSMSSTFTISNVVVNVPGDWTGVITSQPSSLTVCSRDKWTTLAERRCPSAAHWIFSST